jgi:hypothetical protein
MERKTHTEKCDCAWCEKMHAEIAELQASDEDWVGHPLRPTATELGAWGHDLDECDCVWCVAKRARVPATWYGENKRWAVVRRLCGAETLVPEVL